jgi:hypothetical protein
VNFKRIYGGVNVVSTMAKDVTLLMVRMGQWAKGHVTDVEFCTDLEMDMAVVTFKRNDKAVNVRFYLNSPPLLSNSDKVEIALTKAYDKLRDVTDKEE